MTTGTMDTLGEMACQLITDNSDTWVWTQLTLLRVMTLLEATAVKARSLGLLQTNNNKH